MHLLNLAQVSAIILACSSTAHPGEEHHHDHAVAHSKRNFYAHTRRGLSACADKLASRGITSRAAARRQATAQRLSKRGIISTRDTDTVLNKSHHSSGDYSLSTPESTLFGSNSTCVLNPEGEVGPYWVKGELIRNNLTDNEPGVPLTIDGQFIDVETCEPIEGLYWDVWNCNSTGVYSGVTAQGNGNTDDESNLDNTALRGVAESDSDGVVQFTTVFPGHYTGRTTHIHMVAHLNATLNSNKTLSGGAIPHVGQFFFDQSLITQVEATYPYNTNTQTLTTNAEDRVFGEQETADSTADPVFEYVMLGDDISDGLLAWITIVVNQSAAYDPSYSFTYTSSGSVAESGGSAGTPSGGSGSSGNSNGTMPSGGAGGGNGTMPSGNSPSGTGMLMGTGTGSGAMGTGSSLPTGTLGNMTVASASLTAVGTAADTETGSGSITLADSTGAAATTAVGSAASSVSTGAACRGRNILGWSV